MRALKAQYFFFLAVMGSMLPFFSIYLEELGLKRTQIGVVFAVAGLGVFVTPVLLTLLADLRVQQRVLLGAIFAVSGAMLIGLMAVSSFPMVLLFFGLYFLTLAGMNALQDGLYFALQARRQKLDQEPIPYHRVRVYGSLGFMAPSIGLFFLLQWGWPTAVTLACGVLFAVVGLCNALLLPHARHDAVEHLTDREHPKAKPWNRLPTLGAAKKLMRPPMLLFCVAVFLLHITAAGYYGFYPIYLTQEVGIDAKWAGLIASLGVMLELLPMLGFGWLSRKVGLRGVMLLGTAAIVLRMVLMAWLPIPLFAVGTQVLHGMMVLAVHVAPPVLLNHRAGEHDRNSMQGLFTMMVYGFGRLVGSLICGAIAEVSLTGVFWFSAVVSAVAFGLLLIPLRWDSASPGESGDQPNHAEHGADKEGEQANIADGIAPLR